MGLQISHMVLLRIGRVKECKSHWYVCMVAPYQILIVMSFVGVNTMKRESNPLTECRLLIQSMAGRNY